MNIEQISVSEIIPYARNARINDQAVSSVAASIKEFGFQNPIIIDNDNIIIAGHTRHKAALQLGLSTAPCLRASDLSDSQVKAYRLLDNKLAEKSEWNLEMLQLEIADLPDFDFKSFDVDWSFESLEPTLEAKEDDFELPDESSIETSIQLGDLIEIGHHRLLCGDSTSEESIRYLMGISRADALLTDPPYNVNYTGKTKDALTIGNDSMSDLDFRSFLTAAMTAAFGVLKPGASFYIWHADLEGYNFRGAIQDCGEKVRQCLIWAKNTLVMGRQDYHWKHEPCLYGWKEGAAHGWYTDRKQTTILNFDRPTRSTDHPTMKPVTLFSYLIGNSTAPQGLVLDTFLGSGTTMVAAHQLGRTCYGMELSPKYCQVIVDRMTKLDNGLEVKINGS